MIKKTVNYYCTARTGPNDGQYRATIQLDGNLVVYRGRDISKAIWASATNGITGIMAHYGCDFPRPV